MTGKASPLASSVINEIAQAIKLGDSLDPIRSKCSSVPRRTWHNWINKARELAETSGPPKPTKPKRYQDIGGGDFADSASSAGAPPGVPTVRRRRPKPEPAQAPSPTTTQDNPAVTPPDGSSELGPDNVDDEIPGNRTTRRLRAPEEARNNLIDITGELNKSLNLADALLDTCVVKVGDNHTIIDPVGYASALTARHKAIETMFKAYERVTNADQLAAFCNSVLKRVAALDPNTAKAIVADMREMVGSVNPRIWQSQR
ncbi:hypothetical protein [Nevskia sp.]|uniref:hypothetical protein n=1 Tax=Nevskia sp. TaxID=1929292 RepID=UPI0025E4AFA4|nr:hypothetical protein [Nevskia sp.]